MRKCCRAQQAPIQINDPWSTYIYASTPTEAKRFQLLSARVDFIACNTHDIGPEFVFAEVHFDARISMRDIIDAFRFASRSARHAY